jgi:hypothetical protein
MSRCLPAMAGKRAAQRKLAKQAVELLPELKVELVLLGVARSLERVVERAAALPRIGGPVMEQRKYQPLLQILKQQQRIPLLL